MIRAISLWQPWAQLIALGAKRYETRSWSTTFRGLLAIHAAKTRNPDVVHFFRDDRFQMVLKPAGYTSLDALPFGAMICVVELVNVWRAEEVIHDLSAQERAFGNYAVGRYAWELEFVKVFVNPVPVMGKQGLWTWEYEHQARNLK
jgi:activating signal cointegrator 1